MPVLPSSLNYSDKDFDSLRDRLQKLIRSVFPDWSDFNVASFGEMLIELYAFVGDVLGFYQDNQARESRLVTAQQRKNVIALAQFIGYAPRGATAAQATETFSIGAPVAGNVVIPAGFIVSTPDVTAPVKFRLLAPATILAGGLSVDAVIENSEPSDDTFTSTGLPNQKFILSSGPYVDDSLTVSAADGSYAQVDNFLASGATDRHFTVTVDQNDRATISFGNGVSGTIPSGQITTAYRTGGGIGGNVDPNSIRVPAQPSLTDTLGNPVTIRATNALKSQGGTNRQTIQQIKVAAPESLRAETRCVAREDFEINARRVPGVARVLMQTSNEDPAVQENTGNLYVVPEGGGVPTSTMRDAVKTMVTITYPSTLTFLVNVLAPSYARIDVQAVLFMRAGTTPAAGAASVRKALADFFRISLPDGSPNPEIDFGQNYLDDHGVPDPRIALSDLQDVVATAPGIRRVGGGSADFIVNGAHADAIIAARQFPQLGTVKLIDGETGSLL